MWWLEHPEREGRRMENMERIKSNVNLAAFLPLLLGIEREMEEVKTSSDGLGFNGNRALKASVYGTRFLDEG
jgi:gamma-glutamyl-gamma-aminobutyrate hydrolase PuuD